MEYYDTVDACGASDPSGDKLVDIFTNESSDAKEGVEAEGSHSELDPSVQGTPSVNGQPSPAGQARSTPGESCGLLREPVDTDGGSAGGSSEPPDGLNKHPDEPGDLFDDLGDSLGEINWETTRYLAAATQLDLKYARFVVSQIVGEPFRAVAPAAGADVVVVTRWALAALRRRAKRDVALTCLLIGGVAAAVWAWSWIPIAVMTAFAVFFVAYERWVRDVKTVDRRMLRDRFRAHDAPSSPSPRVEERLAVVQEQQEKGNIVVFRDRSAFVGSGPSVAHYHILVNVALGKKKKGKRHNPKPFSIPQLHAVLEKALKDMDFPEMRVGQRLFVSGEHVTASSRLLPCRFGPPTAYAPPDLLYDGCVHPTPEARTYVCAEMGGWKGQLVVSLFTRAVQVNGSLRVEWMFHVLQPLYSNLLLIDQLYEPHRIKQITKAMATGVLWVVPALISAPVSSVRYAAFPLVYRIRIRGQSFRIRNGYVFNYGSPRSIREDLISHRRPHDFVVGDEWTLISLAQHTLLRALARFFKAHKIDMKQFASQEQNITNKINNYSVDEINARSVAVGSKSRASSSKKNSGSSAER